MRDHHANCSRLNPNLLGQAFSSAISSSSSPDLDNMLSASALRAPIRLAAERGPACAQHTPNRRPGACCPTSPPIKCLLPTFVR